MPAGESGTTYFHNPHNAPETRHFDHPHKVMLGLYIGAFLGMLSETSMNIALPDLMDEFSVSSGTAQWMNRRLHTGHWRGDDRDRRRTVLYHRRQLGRCAGVLLHVQGRQTIHESVMNIMAGVFPILG